MRPPRRRALAAAGLLLGAALWIGCSAAERRGALIFFFDGVPGAPAGPAVAQPPGEPTRLAWNDVATSAATWTKAPQPPPVVSVHQPVRERKCRECHAEEKGLDIMAVDATLCDKCHYEQRMREGWDHGPINLGTCIPCHRAHESPWPHLLDAPVPELCLRCHAEDLTRPAEYHAVADIDACGACHDPHRMY